MPTPALFLPASIFFANALLYVTLYSRLPEVTAAQGISPSALGLSLLAQMAGTVLGFPLASGLIARFGARRVSATMLFSAVILLPLAASGRLAPGAIGLAVPLFGYGIAMAIIEVAKNLIAARIEEDTGRNVISKSHGFWSAGLFVGALLGGRAAAAHLDTAGQLLLSGLAALPLILFLLLRPGAPEPVEALPEPGPRFARPDAFVVGILILVAGFSITEGVIYDWSMFYLKREIGLGAESAARIYAAFTLGMFATRMGGDMLRKRLRTANLLRIMALITLAGLALAIGSPAAGLGAVGLLAGFVLIGAGVALGAPVATSLAMRHPTRSATKTMAAYSLISLLALFAVPPLLGTLVQSFGAVWALMVSIPILLCVALLSGRIFTWMSRS